MNTAPMHILEKRVLKALQNASSATVDEIATKAGIGADQTRRALEWLKEKSFVEISQKKVSKIVLGREGEKVALKGLPERRIVQVLVGKKSVPLRDLSKLSGLDRDSFSGALGIARTLGWVEMRKEVDETVVTLKVNPQTTEEEKLLSKLKTSSDRKILTSEEEKVLSNLMKRPRFIEEQLTQISTVRLTEAGSNIAKDVQIEEGIGVLTSGILASGTWKTLPIDPANVEAPPPVIYPGKKHPLQTFIDEVREIFISMGFEEIEGTLVQPSFWNFDALFTPQDHPSRELQDTFYVAGQRNSNPADATIIKNVSNAHTNGGATGSKGWQYDWKLDEAERTVLRTHTTCITVRYLADNRPEEARVFSVGRVFRNEKVSFKHIAE